MNPFYTQFESPEILKTLEPEEIAFLIVRYLNSITGEKELLHIQDFDADQNRQYEFFTCKHVVMEGWCWLENHGLLIRAEGMNGNSGYRVLSRRGKSIKDKLHFREFQHSQHLRREMLHDRIRERVWEDFVRGNFDAAVMHSFKALEVYAREVARYDNSLHGQELFQKAFRLAKNSNPPGPLTDQTLEPSEQEGQRSLFVGAYMYYRNPAAHRNVDICSADRALEIILLANQLFHIVDAAKHRISIDADQ